MHCVQSSNVSSFMIQFLRENRAHKFPPHCKKKTTCYQNIRKIEISFLKPTPSNSQILEDRISQLLNSEKDNFLIITKSILIAQQVFYVMMSCYKYLFNFLRLAQNLIFLYFFLCFCLFQTAHYLRRLRRQTSFTSSSSSSSTVSSDGGPAYFTAHTVNSHSPDLG